MKKVFLLLTIAASVGLFACGEKKDENNETSTESTESSEGGDAEGGESAGPLATINYSEYKIGNSDKKYFKMVEGSSDITWGEHDQIYVSAEFEVVATFTGKLGQYQTEQAFVELLALDKDNNPIKLMSTTKGAMRTNDSDGSQFADFLRGEPGYKQKFIFSGSVSGAGFETDKPATEEAAKKIVGFKVLTEK